MDNNKQNNIMNMDVKDIAAFLKKKFKKKNSAKKTTIKKKKVVSLDIGSSNIKIVEGLYHKDVLTIKKSVNIPTPKDSVVDGDIRNKDSVIQAISVALSENKISAKDAICTTNSSLIINREFVIPKINEDEIETYVKFELQKYLSINLDDYIVQVSILDDNISENINNMKVRVIAFPRKLSDKYFYIINKLKLKPYILDVSYNSLNKILKITNKIEEKKEYDKATVAIDFGAESVNVSIFNNNILDFTRLIKSGGNDIDDNLVDMCNMPRNKAFIEKSSNCDLMNLNEEKSNVIIKDIVDEWIEKIEKILNFYRSKNQNTTIDKIYIYGGSSNISGIDKYIEARLNVKTEKLIDIANKNIVLKDNQVNIDNQINSLGAVIRL